MASPAEDSLPSSPSMPTSSIAPLKCMMSPIQVNRAVMEASSMRGECAPGTPASSRSADVERVRLGQCLAPRPGAPARWDGIGEGGTVRWHPLAPRPEPDSDRSAMIWQRGRSSPVAVARGSPKGQSRSICETHRQHYCCPLPFARFGVVARAPSAINRKWSGKIRLKRLEGRSRGGRQAPTNHGERHVRGGSR